MRIYLLLVLLSINLIIGQHPNPRTGIFLHHSTGNRIWGPNESSTSIPLEIDKFNDSLNFSNDSSFVIYEKSWPLDPWNNEWYRWHRVFNNQDSTADINQILQDYEIVIIKSCFPSSAIVDRGGSPQDTLTFEKKSIYNYKWHWRNFIKEMEKHSDNFFAVWTNTPLIPIETNDKSAKLSDEFCRWAKDTLATGLDPIYGAFPPNVYVFDFFHKLAGPDGKMLLEFTEAYNNNHPNSVATELVAPQFVREILGAALEYETSAEISLPILRLPINGENEISLTPLLDWSDTPNATNYKCQVSVEENFTDTLISVDSIFQSDYLIPEDLLKVNTKYFWRVKAINAGGESEWSNIWSFGTLGIPLAPSLILPKNNSELPDTVSNVEFVWSTVVSGETYTIEASINETFDSLFISENTNDTTYAYINKFIPGLFYWRVKGINQAGSSEWSETFTVSIISYAEYKNKTIPQKFALMQNYPNPFNSTTIINYSLSEKSNVRIQIINMLGQIITTIVNKEENPGYYRVKWNAIDIPSGVYIYKIIARTKTGTSLINSRKMLFLK